MADKNRYWVAVCYPENMIPDWKENIGDLLQLPYAYCVHDKDTLIDSSDDRKVHVHIMIAFSNTTTYKHALKVFDSLSRPGFSCLNTCLPVFNVKHMYDYLIHNTEDCKKKHKYLYSTLERITGNNFDIGSFEQLSAAEKNDIAYELCSLIIAEGMTNFSDFFISALSTYDTATFEVIKGHSGLFERLCKGNYLKYSGK